MRYEGGQYYIKSPDEMEKLFPYAKEALNNTHDIANRCDVTITFGEYKLPVFDVPKEYTVQVLYATLTKKDLEEVVADKLSGNAEAKETGLVVSYCFTSLVSSVANATSLPASGF